VTQLSLNLMTRNTQRAVERTRQSYAHAAEGGRAGSSSAKAAAQLLIVTVESLGLLIDTRV